MRCLFKSIQYSDQAFGGSLEMLWGFAASKHGYHSNQNSGPTCLSAKTQTHLSSAIHSIPWASQDRRVVQPIVIKIPCYPWNYVKLSNLQLRSIPLKICFRNPLLPPICFPFKFHSIPPMLPHGNRGRKLPFPSLHTPGFLPTERRLKGGNCFEAKTSKIVTAESLRNMTYMMYVYYDIICICIFIPVPKWRWSCHIVKLFVVSFPLGGLQLVYLYFVPRIISYLLLGQ